MTDDLRPPAPTTERVEVTREDEEAARRELIERSGLWRSREDFGDDSEKEAALARFYAQARAEGERAGFELGQTLMHAHCLASEINEHREEWMRAGAEKERAAVVRWLLKLLGANGETLLAGSAKDIERGEHLRAARPEVRDGE